MPRKMTLLGVLSLLVVSVLSCRQAKPSPTASTVDAAISVSTVTSGTPVSTSAPQPSAPCHPSDAGRKITIMDPCDGARVAPREFVEGTVLGENARVWVVVHPMEAADYWVQPNVTVREGGKWKVLCYFGEPGQQHSGKSFEVMAFVNPTDSLKEGQLLPDWPPAESKSQVIEVVRQ